MRGLRPGAILVELGWEWDLFSLKVLNRRRLRLNLDNFFYFLNNWSFRDNKMMSVAMGAVGEAWYGTEAFDQGLAVVFLQKGELGATA